MASMSPMSPNHLSVRHHFTTTFCRKTKKTPLFRPCCVHLHHWQKKAATAKGCQISGRRPTEKCDWTIIHKHWLGCCECEPYSKYFWIIITFFPRWLFLLLLTLLLLLPLLPVPLLLPVLLRLPGLLARPNVSPLLRRPSHPVKPILAQEKGSQLTRGWRINSFCLGARDTRTHQFGHQGG